MALLEKGEASSFSAASLSSVFSLLVNPLTVPQGLQTLLLWLVTASQENSQQMNGITQQHFPYCQHHWLPGLTRHLVEIQMNLLNQGGGTEFV